VTNQSASSTNSREKNKHPSRTQGGKRKGKMNGRRRRKRTRERKTKGIAEKKGRERGKTL